MRNHLSKCFDEQKMVPFPTVRERRALPEKLIQVDVYWYCRCPDNLDVTMISCDGPCKGWYHLGECVDINQKNSVWFFKNCRAAS